MNDYTVILLYKWSIYGDEIKKLLHLNKLKWNDKKIVKLSNEELKIELKKFLIDDEVDFSESMVGMSGIYENDNCAIKIIKIESIDNIVLVYKSLITKESEIDDFYIKFIKYCKDIGCLIMKISDGQIIFKDRINVEFIKQLYNIEGEKNMKIKNFKIKMESSTYSDWFKEKWISLIKDN